jgi:hypothetical protein
MRVRAGAAFLVSALAGACGFSGVGTAEPGDAGEPTTELPDADSSAPTPGALDAAVDVATDANADADAQPAACTTSSTTCTSALEAGWTAIAFASDRTAACPAGYITRDLVKSPAAAAGACTCACAINAADPPTCAKGSFAGLIGTSTCTTTGVTYNVNGAGCTSLNQTGNLSTVARYAPLALTKGTCDSSVTKDAAKLGSTPVRACEPPPACGEDVCRGDGLAPFGSCIAHDGDVACPAGPFTTKTLTGPSATLTCGGCASCTNTASCGPAKLHFFNDSACATEVATRLVNDACNAVASGTPNATNSYFKYEVATMNAACTASTTPTTAVALDLPRTICCR